MSWWGSLEVKYFIVISFFVFMIVAPTSERNSSLGSTTVDGRNLARIDIGSVFRYSHVHEQHFV